MDLLDDREAIFIACMTCVIISITTLLMILLRAALFSRTFLSKMAWSFANTDGISSSVLRAQFKDLNIENHRLGSNHTHPDSAAERSSASTVIDAFGQRVGKTPYFIQCSQADWRNNREGSRSYYWAKDLSVKPQVFNPPPHAIHALVDVDHYMDMPQFLTEHFAPTMIYTFQPESVAASGKEFSFTFDKDANVDYKVSGGGSFNHKIWNYGSDNLLVTRYSWFMPVETVAYNIDHRRCGEHHKLILLAPLAKWSGFGALFANIFAGYQLERLNPVHKDKEHLRMKIHKQDGTYISTGRVGEYACATIPAALDNAVATVARTSKIGLTLASVRTYTESKVDATALFSFHRTNQPSVMPVVFPVEDSVRRYQFIPKVFEEDTKCSLKAFMSPIIHGAFAPDLCVNNEVTCIQGRILDVKNSTKMTPFLNEVMNEFCELFFPDPHILRLTTVDEVYEKQNRPSQRYSNNTAGLYQQAKQVIKMFVKKEAYQNAKDPRPISTLDPKTKLEYSQVIYPLSDHLKKQPWYAFGKSPKEVSERICEILDSALNATNSDFSRFDGHVSEVLRDLEQMLLVRGFSHADTEHILELHRSQFNIFAVGTFGTKYNTGYARASGSPETSSFNSIACAFTAFLAFRKTRVNGAFLTAQEAWARLGIYGGDDGLTADIDPFCYDKAAKMVGQVLTTDVIKRGDLGITFLSRMYGPDVWFGDDNSCCDLPRQLSKLHTTPALASGVTAEMKLLEKARAYYLTDRNTPILGRLVTKIVEIHGTSIEMNNATLRIRRWGSDIPFDRQYPNRLDNWMDHYAQTSLVDGIGMNVDMFNTWLDTCTTIEDCLSPPLCAEPVPCSPKRRVVVDGIQMDPEPSVKQNISKRTVDVKSSKRINSNRGTRRVKPRSRRVNKPKSPVAQAKSD